LQERRGHSQREQPLVTFGGSLSISGAVELGGFKRERRRGDQWKDSMKNIGEGGLYSKNPQRGETDSKGTQQITSRKKVS